MSFTPIARPLAVAAILLACGFASTVALRADAPAPGRPNTATIPAIKMDTTRPSRPQAQFLTKHENNLKRVQEGPIDLLFMGDSITDNWRGPGKDVWARYFAPLHAANFGIGGDRTQHVLWRLDNGELTGYRAKLVVLMIGTNNLGPASRPANTNEEIVEANKAIIEKFRQGQPQAKILLLGIFPRADRADDPLRARITAINTELAKMADNQTVFYMDIGHIFLAPDGTLPRSIMPDVLHPNAHGYQLEADAIIGKVLELMGLPTSATQPYEK